jgi:hypothetical protein
MPEQARTLFDKVWERHVVADDARARNGAEPRGTFRR